jgi:2-amino-4-hydroxy-6-hydroxymethyldihydropteridine diphosphokinase
MHTIFLALGSNVGKKKSQLVHAIELLQSHVHNLVQGGWYETKAVGYTDQDNFLNTVIKGQTELTPAELLVFVKDIEQNVGRIHRFRWGPREIDIDILFYDDLIYADTTLTIPHPLLHERDFVLAPLLDITETLVHPVLKKTISELFDDLPEESKSIITKIAS